MTTEEGESYGGTSPTETSPPTRLEELLEASKSMELPRLRGYSIKLSKYSKKQLSRDHPLVARKKRKKRKPRRDTLLKKARELKRRYRAKSLLSEEPCYRFYKTRYQARWKITPEEWGYIWAEYDLEGSSPLVVPLDGSVDLTPYTILIRSMQEKNLRDTIYDGQSREIEELML